MNPRFFPILMIVLSLGAAIIYAYHKDWRRVMYWVSSATIIISITF